MLRVIVYTGRQDELRRQCEPSIMSRSSSCTSSVFSCATHYRTCQAAFMAYTDILTASVFGFCLPTALMVR